MAPVFKCPIKISNDESESELETLIRELHKLLELESANNNNHGYSSYSDISQHAIDSLIQEFNAMGQSETVVDVVAEIGELLYDLSQTPVINDGEPMDGIAQYPAVNDVSINPTGIANGFI